MLHRTLVVLGLVVATFTSDAAAQVTLKLKFEPGKTFKQRVVQKVEQSLTLNGMDIPTKADITMLMAISYGQRDANGNLPVSSKTESLKADLSIQGSRISFDSDQPSEKPDNPNPVVELVADRLRKLNGLVVTHTISADNKTVISVNPPKEDVVDPDDVQEQAQQRLDLLPAEPLKPGDTWERTVKTDLGQGQVFTFQRMFKYVGQVDEFATVPGSRKLDKITATDARVEYSIRNPAGGLTVKKSDLKVESSKHTLLFDRNAGRFVDTDDELHIKGELVLSINNMDLSGQLDLTISSREQETK